MGGKTLPGFFEAEPQLLLAGPCLATGLDSPPPWRGGWTLANDPIFPPNPSPGGRAITRWQSPSLLLNYWSRNFTKGILSKPQSPIFFSWDRRVEAMEPFKKPDPCDTPSQRPAPPPPFGPERRENMVNFPWEGVGFLVEKAPAAPA